ncbi:hypothetical protein CFC21_049803 [Triticum aestivum]|uniref:KIB1-4 beta-propeller domain-containing protein n=4 Tax=Triticinae TaxID=1648030 RepID=A0A3B6H0M0_WHEAT|nr:uncharacterized protein LOC123075477 [Triticum aestivum]XP_044354008.1 uncharacterized protein LOC123075477 [Triticum aestivum]XP_045090394.1 uncharacterized protein LOC109738295 [Aegilops tauschii subsp. strangulata]KAF7039859.1 hypothetical protein CFC21_049803 [Triticum aestivum]
MAAPATEAPVLPPAKRNKADTSLLHTSAALPAADWSALLPDLVRRVADSLLATNDLDCYMDFRAVCSGWRAATDDPRSDPSDPRFRPQRWVILDDGADPRFLPYRLVFLNDGADLLLLNAATGRFLRKRTPLRRRYSVVATTPGGLFVLADRNHSRAACVFNPLTGVLIRFAAPVPTEEVAVATVVFGRGSSPTLNLFCDSSLNFYVAAPVSESFNKHNVSTYYFLRKAVRGGWGLCYPWRYFVMCKIFDLIESLHVDPIKFFSQDLPVAGHTNDHGWCFLVELGGQVLVVIKLHRCVKVFKMEVDSIVPVESIGSHAIFIGHHRCLAVDTHKFPSVEANCIYYVERLASSAYICMYNLKDEEDEMISAGAVDFMKTDKLFVIAPHRPFTIIHLLSSYTINVRDSQLPLQQDAN